MGANPWEERARLVKALALADFLEANGVTDAGAGAFQPEHWQMAAKAAGTRAPSPSTCALVVEQLKERRVLRESRKPVAAEAAAAVEAVA